MGIDPTVREEMLAAVPSLRAYAIPFSMPTACIVRTAGMLRLCSIAFRSGIGPRKAPS